VAQPEFDRHLSPRCGCLHATSTLSLLLKRPETLDASVVDSDGAHVATLAESQDFPAGRASFDWDGRGDDGQVVPDGLYRLKVRLENDRRTILIPKTVLVDTTAPRLRIIEAVSGVDGLQVRYKTNEDARVTLLLNGKKVERGRRGGVTWQPMGVAASTEGLTLVAVDRAGNRSQPVPVVATP
jgi:hypothetical protein